MTIPSQTYSSTTSAQSSGTSSSSSAPEQRPPMPPTYLAVAIITTIFCCLPFGIVAISLSSKVERYYLHGLYGESLKASSDAKKWSIVSAVVAAVCWLLFIAVMVWLGTADPDSYADDYFDYDY